MRSRLVLLLMSSLAAGGLPAHLAAQQVIDLPGRDRPLSARFEDVYRVGGMDAPEWAAFQRVFHVGFDGQGRLYIADPLGKRVVVVGRDGTLARIIGRSGEGPGEFKSISGMAVGTDGAVIVHDFSLRRLTLFEPGGGEPVIRSIDIRTELPGKDLHAIPGGVVSTQLGMSASTPDAPSTRGVAIMRHDVRAGRPGREIHRAYLPPDQRGGGYIRLEHMAWKGFETGVFVAPLPDGRIALADTSTWTVKLLSATGELERVLRRPVAPLPVTRKLIAQEKERRKKQWTNPANRPTATVSGGGGGGGGSAPAGRPASTVRFEGYLDEMVFPDIVPVITRMLADGDGRLWVQRTGSDPWRKGPTDVVDATGRYLGTLPAPAPGVPDAFGPDGLVAYIEKDALDVPSVVVRRVVIAR